MQLHLQRRGPSLSMVTIFLLLSLNVGGCTKKFPLSKPPSMPTEPVPSPPPSTLTTHLQVSLSSLEPLLNASVPESFSGEDCVALGVFCGQAYATREPLLIKLTGQHLKLSTVVHYELDGSFLGIGLASCGHPDQTRRRTSLTYDADVSLNSDWTMKVGGVSAKVSPYNNDRCELTIFNVDKTDTAMNTFQHRADDLASRATAKVTSDPALKTAANDIWHILSSPIIIDEGLYLRIHPDKVRVSEFTSTTAGTLRATVGITAKPILALGQPKENPSITDIPNFEAFPAEDDQFRVIALVRLPFEQLNMALSNEIKGKTYHVGKRQIKVADTAVTGYGDNLIVGLKLTGAVTGTAWVLGKIDYKPADRILTVKIDQAYADTNNFLLKSVQWLSPDFLVNTVRDALGSFRLDVGQRSEDLRERARQALNRKISDKVTLATSINSPEIRGPFSDENGYVFTLTLSGRSEIDYSPTGTPFPTGSEVIYVSVVFATGGDDKDAEEPITLTLMKNGQAIAQRQVGVTEKWANNENQGPYFLRIPAASIAQDCRSYALRIRKEPAGSSTGKGWIVAVSAFAHFSNGTQRDAAYQYYSQWGDGDDHPYDRTFSLCQ